jgi:hypothetical protein
MKRGFPEEELEKARTHARNIAEGGQLDELVLFRRGMGGDYNAILVSFHRSYIDYTELFRKITESPFIDISATLSFIIDLKDKMKYRHFTFSTLAKYLLTMPK